MRVGDLIVFQYIAEVEEEPSELEKVSRIAEASSAKISARLVQDWNLPDAILQAVKCGGRWDYKAESQPDYGELMVATNVHLRMLNSNMRGLPDLNEIPAITRIINDDFSPETSVILLAKQALEEYKTL
jgi:HD-like signal output (HDOD) protein